MSLLFFRGRIDKLFVAVNMTSLLDHIFCNLEGRELDRGQIESYIQYLDELILHGLPLEKEKTYHTLKLQLQNRLNNL
ncbi:hypothetical protein AHMF7605_21705 [Adhaeribacter arboris]|uniref:Uncharacterized protein n=1 Tax=Adhaeribacter arboris TaxID=2072846 RepID=A0A2T2YK97_9BACT|nr:hypothetical protein AHMF7605_21705 [Adhaeribacter arboris]